MRRDSSSPNDVLRRQYEGYRIISGEKSYRS
jgi:hypothetical protein